MFRVSNSVIAILNFFSLIISLIPLGGALQVHQHAGPETQKLLQTPLLILGGFLFVVSLFGLIGSCSRLRFFHGAYLFLLLLLIVGLFCFTIFALAVTNKKVGDRISGVGFKNYRLGDYSHWLQKHLINDENWDGIKNSYLIDSEVCSSINGDVNQKDNQPIQSGCCRPPTSCGFEYKNATFWVVPKSGPADEDSDCTTWSNNREKLCYDCKSCKGGVLEIVRSQWRKLTIFNVSLLVFLIVVYSIACCAFRNNQPELKYERYQGYA